MDAESRLTLAYLKSHPLEVSRQLESWPPADVATIMAPYSPQDIAVVLEHISPSQAARILEHLALDKTADVVTLLPTAPAVGILRQCNPSVQKEVFARLDRSVGPSLRLSMAYPDGTAASLADPRVAILPPDITVSAALERIKRDAAHATYYHYVVKRDGILAGLVTTKELLAASPDQLTATIMNGHIATVAAEATEGELPQNPHWRLYHTLPVVDRQGYFLGALRYRTLRRVEAQFEVKPTAGPLPQALVQMWEAYAMIGLHIMTDLAQAVDASVSEQKPTLPKEGKKTDATSQETP
ncbi:MAG: CBS domain-containing protein [Nitrospira sp.]|nr:CBS domain-containing protein [Nitrospira sp.]MDH4243931.1 CBS domain-containing protein [Nitrospira sp.]MDH4354788.1 CBS domain-containing protein [Nitrospira sp.]MDH5316731.1 CBS domain-containing protein [Nitrospira sp.]